MKNYIVLFFIVFFSCASYHVNPDASISGKTMIPSIENYLIRTGQIRNVGSREYPVIGFLSVDGQKKTLVQYDRKIGDSEIYFLINGDGSLYSKYLAPVYLQKAPKDNEFIFAPMHTVSTIPPDVIFSIAE